MGRGLASLPWRLPHNVCTGGIHRECPCGRGAGGCSPGPQPSEEAWDQIECRCEAGSLEPSRSITAPLRFVTEPLQILYSFITARYALLRLCTGSVPTPTGIRLISVTKIQSKGAPSPRGNTLISPPPDYRGRLGGVRTRQDKKATLYPKALERGLGRTTASGHHKPPPLVPAPVVEGRSGSVSYRRNTSAKRSVKSEDMYRVAPIVPAYSIRVGPIVATAPRNSPGAP